MPLPLIPIIIVVGTGLFVARKVSDAVVEKPPREGYCSHCGRDTTHGFHASGVTWSKSGPAAVLFGTLGLGILSLGSRNVYKCRSCSGLTLPCRFPFCEGMAKSGRVYDDEFCGTCFRANDAAAADARASRSQAESAKLIEVLRRQEEKLRAAEAALAREKAKRRADKQRIADLTALVKALKRDGDVSRRALGMERPA